MAENFFNEASDKALRLFADMMIEKIKAVEDNWKTPWFSNRGKGFPQNLSGRKYNGVNSMMLYLMCEDKNYKVPVFMTFNQAKENNVMVKSGEKSFPVLYWNFSVKGINPENKDVRITIDDYNKLPKEEQEKFKVQPYLKVYNVFNVEQTTFPEKKVEEWEKLKEKFKAPELKDTAGMFACPELDILLKNQKWLCPIDTISSDKAFYSPGKDYIQTPLKGQFQDGESFYSTLLHEMAHSTGAESRLNRNIKNLFGDPKYAKEELVAELTSAMTCQSLGISSTIREENAMYLKNWLGALKEEPSFILTVLTDANKAMNMINDTVEKQDISTQKDLDKFGVLNENHHKFFIEELPLNSFKSIGVNPSNIPNEDMQRLLCGEHTKNSIQVTIKDQADIFQLDAHLALNRNSDSVSLLVFPVKNKIKRDSKNKIKPFSFKRKQ